MQGAFPVSLESLKAWPSGPFVGVPGLQVSCRGFESNSVVQGSSGCYFGRLQLGTLLGRLPHLSSDLGLAS